jgi:hypothetical protein
VIALDPRINLGEEDKDTEELDEEECEEYEDVEVSGEEDEDTEDEDEGRMMKSTDSSYTIVQTDLETGIVLSTTQAARQKREVIYVFTFLYHLFMR